MIKNKEKLVVALLLVCSLSLTFYVATGIYGKYKSKIMQDEFLSGYDEVISAVIDITKHENCNEYIISDSEDRISLVNFECSKAEN